jgi:putative DNA primase/helicase
MPTANNQLHTDAPPGAEQPAASVHQLPLTAPDRAVIARFARVMFKHADPDSYVSLRGLPHEPDARPVHNEAISVGDLAYLIDRAVYGAGITAEAKGVFAPPVATFSNPAHARDADLAEGLTISVDIDSGETGAKRDKLTAILGEPTMVVASGGEWIDADTGVVHDKLHVHWRLAVPTRTPEDHARLATARRWAVQLVDSDRTGAPVSHPFRWPGTLHMKGEPRFARIVAETEAEVDLEAALEALRAAGLADGLVMMSRTATRTAGRVMVESDLPANLARAEVVALAAAPAATGLWHPEGFKLGARMCRLGLSEERAVEVLDRCWRVRGSGFKSHDRFRADVLGGYGDAFRKGTHGEETPEAVLAGVTPPEPEHETAAAAAGAAVASAMPPPPPPPPVAAVTGVDIIQDNDIARTDLKAGLAQSLRGDVVSTLANMILILKNEPLLRGLVGLDSFSSTTMISRPPPRLDRTTPPAAGPYPRELRDDDTTRILAFLQQAWCPDFRVSDLSAAIETEARDNAFHPVCNWLDGLVWDGVPRAETWLCAAFGAEDTAYHRAVASKWLVAAVRRVRQPGCKFDYLPVLQGDQGIGKSRALAALFGQDWFADKLPDDLGGKEAAIALKGKWCIELGEITQLVKNDTETVKAFLSRSVDRYREPYARRAIDVPRQGVLIGTTNPGEYLRDPTGNRRFWPVTCGKGLADYQWVIDHREQLWAEASCLETQGGATWLEEDVIRVAAEAAQAEAMEEDPWAQKVYGYLAGHTSVAIPDILQNVLCLPVGLHTKAHQMRVSAILKGSAWARKKVWDGQTARTAWRWAAPDDWEVRRPAMVDPFAVSAFPPSHH